MNGSSRKGMMSSVDRTNKLNCTGLWSTTVNDLIGSMRIVLPDHLLRLPL
jgi:hypothetical protein